MKIAIIINTKRLNPELEARLRSDEFTKKYYITYDLFFPEPEEIENVLKNLNYQAYNACLVGGGDGTVRTAAQILIEQELPLIILPLGTFNVLAKALGYPNDIDAIFNIIKNYKTKRIDLAEVDGNIIVNHAWIGFYYYILKLREKHKDILGRNKLLKIIFNMFHFFKFLPVYNLEFRMNGEIIKHKTCLVYISNNEGNTTLHDFAGRKTLSSGLLSITILTCRSRLDLLFCLLQVLIGRFHKNKYIEYVTTNEVTISAQSDTINTVIDGELFKLKTPLHFINHNRELAVLVP